MKTLVYLWDFRPCFDALKKYRDYKKIIIVDSSYLNRSPIKEGIFDELHIANNIFDLDEVKGIFRNLINENNIINIIASSERVVEVAAYIRSEFNIDGIKLEDAVYFRNKSLMKEKVRRAGLNTAQSTLIKSCNDIESFIEAFEYPFIVKDLDGCGTKDTLKVHSKDELIGYVKGRKEDKFDFLLEEFIVGEEYHCDCIVVNGEVVFSSIGKYLFNMLDTVLEKKPVGTIVYPSLDRSNDCIINFNKEIVKALDIKNAVCHSEYFKKENGEIYFGEIAVRVGGGTLIGSCIKNTHNVDIYKAFIDVEMNNFNMNLDSNTSKIYTGGIAYPSYQGVVKEISTASDFNDVEGIVKTYFMNKPGDKIKDTNSTAVRTGYSIVEDSNYEKLRQKLIDMHKRFKLVVE